MVIKKKINDAEDGKLLKEDFTQSKKITVRTVELLVAEQRVLGLRDTLRYMIRSGEILSFRYSDKLGVLNINFDIDEDDDDGNP